MPGGKFAQEGEARARHADDQIELARGEAADELERLFLIFERAFLHGRSNERVAPLAADQRFHLLRAAALQTQDLQSVKPHPFSIACRWPNASPTAQAASASIA